MGFVANFIRFPAMQKCENRLRVDKFTESIKVGTFLDTVYYVYVTVSYTRSVTILTCQTSVK